LLPLAISLKLDIMEGLKDDLKWFGEGFDGFPKRLPEDCVEYMLFIIDSSLTQRELLSQFEVVRKEALKLTKKLLKDYLWQRDEFSLKSEIQALDGKNLSLQHVKLLAKPPSRFEISPRYHELWRLCRR
jgi:hypothetical protein